MVKTRNEFNKNVFINCPFDDQYAPLFYAVVFTVLDVGFKPRCALEASNAGQNRLNKILEIIAECKYSIHDLSRTELDSSTQLPRFNMPFEFGLDMGCKQFGNARQKQKNILVLDVHRYRYQTFISDISGQDIYAHYGEEREVIAIIRDWLRQEIDPMMIMIPSGKEIYERYQKFRDSLPAMCIKFKWDMHQLPFLDFIYAVAAWIEENPVYNG